MPDLIYWSAVWDNHRAQISTAAWLLADIVLGSAAVSLSLCRVLEVVLYRLWQIMLFVSWLFNVKQPHSEFSRSLGAHQVPTNTADAEPSSLQGQRVPAWQGQGMLPYAGAYSPRWDVWPPTFMSQLITVFAKHFAWQSTVKETLFVLRTESALPSIGMCFLALSGCWKTLVGRG